MIQMLSAVGRAVVVVAAVIIVGVTTIAGSWFARATEVASYDRFTVSEGGQITPLELVYSLSALGSGWSWRAPCSEQ